VQYSELTHYHLNQGSELPDIKKLTMQVLSQMRVSLCGQMRTDACLWGIGPARLRQRVREKIPDRFLPNL
jgi:hypothetical protein